MKTYLDVMKIVRDELTNSYYLVIPSESGRKKIRARLKDIDYEGEVIVSPENGSPKTQKFIIRSSKASGDGKPSFNLI